MLAERMSELERALGAADDEIFCTLDSGRRDIDFGKKDVNQSSDTLMGNIADI